jgi:hypothetical protein
MTIEYGTVLSFLIFLDPFDIRDNLPESFPNPNHSALRRIEAQIITR